MEAAHSLQTAGGVPATVSAWMASVPQLLHEASTLHKLSFLYFYALLAGMYVRFAVLPRKAGRPRLVASLPVVFMHLVVPFVLDFRAGGIEPLLITPATATFSLAAFKVCMCSAPSNYANADVAISAC